MKKSGASIFGGKEQTQFAVLLESKESEDYDDHLDEFTKAARNFEDKVASVGPFSSLKETKFKPLICKGEISTQGLLEKSQLLTNNFVITVQVKRSSQR